jgi:hypothetical protein
MVPSATKFACPQSLLYVKITRNTSQFPQMLGHGKTIIWYVSRESSSR